MSAVTSSRGHLTVELNGLKLALRYESENMMELSRLVGADPISWLQRIQRNATNATEVGMRASDLNVLVPLLDRMRPRVREGVA